MAQTLGLNLLSRLLADARLSDFYLLRREHFTEGAERDCFDWLTRQLEEHGILPTVEFAIRKKKLKAVDSEDPYGVWYTEYITRAMYGRFNTLLPELNKRLADRDTRGAFDQVLKFVDEAQIINADAQRDLFRGHEVAGEVIERLRELRGKHGLTGIPTGFPTVDEATHGYQGGDLVVFAARPGIGKSTLAIKTMLAAHNAGMIPMLVTMEMPRVQITTRMMAMMTGMNMKLLRIGQLSSFGEARLIAEQEAMRVSSHPLYIIEGQFRKNINDLAALVLSVRPHILIVDGAYLLKLPTVDARMPIWQRIGEIAEKLKSIAMTNNIPVWTTFQINREGGKKDKSGKDPGVEHLMLADAIGQLASLVVGMFSDEGGDNPDAEVQRRLRSLKGREGENFQLLMNWRWDTMNFEEIEDPLANMQVISEADVIRRENDGETGNETDSEEAEDVDEVE